MPKMKTHKSVAKKVKVTGSGKLLRCRGGKRHLATGKPAKRKRQLRKKGLISESYLKTYKRLVLA